MMMNTFRKTIDYLRSDKETWKAFRRHGDWITRFTIGGKAYGGWYVAEGDKRLDQFWAAFPGCRTILELGSLEGGHTFQLARRPGVEKVVALEGREYNIGKARFIQGLLGIGNITFALANFETDGFTQHGTFDAVLSLGVLYHLSKPWEHLKLLRKSSGKVFLWTHYTLDPKAKAEPQAGYPGVVVREYGYKDPLSGLMQASFWPTLDGLKSMLADAGYPDIRVLETDPGHRDGPCVTLSAQA